MNASGFDYSAIWKASGLTIDDPWIQAKDLALIFPKASASMLRYHFCRCKHLLNKKPHHKLHVAEVAHALDTPLQYTVDCVRQVRGV